MFVNELFVVISFYKEFVVDVIKLEGEYKVVVDKIN